MSSFPTTRRRSPLFVIAATIGVVLVLSLSPVTGRVYAAEVFGALRQPGEGAFVAGHRGDRSGAPENTMPAFELAFAGPMEFVETDVQLTRDGVPVLFHDVTLDRKTDGHGPVANYTAAELARLDAGAWYGRSHAGVGIPTLDEFLAGLTGSGKKALLELKFDWTSEQLRAVIESIDRHAAGGRLVLASFSIETLTNLRVAAPELPRIMLVREFPADPVPMAHRFGVIALAATAKEVAGAPDVVGRLHEAGLGVICYTLNSEEDWREMRAHGVDGIITDTPGDLDTWLEATTPGTRHRL